MTVKAIVDEDFSNYKKCSMFIIFPKCTLKCDKENCNNYCHNSKLIDEPDVIISSEDVYKRYINNPLSSAVVIGGLEPFDSFDDLLDLLTTFRVKHDCMDDIIVYTGYIESEISLQLQQLKDSKCLPLIIKFGRFRPNQNSHYDKILGVELANNEQYAKFLKG